MYLAPLFLSLLSPAAAPLSAQNPPTSSCFIFIDYQFIWTLEMVQNVSGRSVPVVNIVTFAKGQWDLRPNQVHLVNAQGAEAAVDRFSIDTGVPEEPYIVQYLKVQGEAFIGLDLVGSFAGFERLSEAFIDLDNLRFRLAAVDPLAFERIVHKINQINFDSPDLRQDFEILDIDPIGRRETVRKYY